MGVEEQLGGNADTIRRWLEQRASYQSEEVRLRVDASLRPEVEPAPPAPAAPAGPDVADAGASVVAALRGEAAPARPSAPRTPRPTRPAVDRSGRVTLRAPETREVRDATYAARAISVDFAPRHGVRRVLGGLVLGMVGATTAAGVLAWRSEAPTPGVAAVVLGVLTLVVWGARAATVPWHVRVVHGQLEVVRGGRRETADLANALTPIAVVGRPGTARWRVLVERPGEALLEIDRTMVDPEAFTQMLVRVHPELWTAPAR